MLRYFRVTAPPPLFMLLLLICRFFAMPCCFSILRLIIDAADAVDDIDIASATLPPLRCATFTAAATLRCCFRCCAAFDIAATLIHFILRAYYAAADTRLLPLRH